MRVLQLCWRVHPVLEFIYTSKKMKYLVFLQRRNNKGRRPAVVSRRPPSEWSHATRGAEQTTSHVQSAESTVCRVWCEHYESHPRCPGSTSSWDRGSTEPQPWPWASQHARQLSCRHRTCPSWQHCWTVRYILFLSSDQNVYFFISRVLAVVSVLLFGFYHFYKHYSPSHTKSP